MCSNRKNQPWLPLLRIERVPGFLKTDKREFQSHTLEGRLSIYLKQQHIKFPEATIKKRKSNHNSTFQTLVDS